MLEIITLGTFERDLKKAERRGKDMKKYRQVLKLLIEQKPLPIKYDNHKLKGEYHTCWECKIEPNWLVIYKKTDSKLILIRMGTHSDLFKGF